MTAIEEDFKCWMSQQGCLDTSELGVLLAAVKSLAFAAYKAGRDSGGGHGGG